MMEDLQAVNENLASGTGAWESVMSSPLPEAIKTRALKIAEQKGYEVQDPGTVWTGDNGKQWVFAVDRKTDKPVWILLE